MRPRIVGRERIVLLVAAAACAAILAIARGVPRLFHWYADERAKAEALTEHAAVARAAVAGATDLAALLAERRRGLESLRTLVFVAPTPNAARAALAAHVARVARTARVELGAVQLSPDSAETFGIRRIGLVINGKADVHGLMLLLTALESGEKLFRITEASVTQPNVAAGPDAPEELSIRLSMQALAASDTSR